MKNKDMKNIKFVVLAVLATLCTSILAQKKYTFDDGVALETDWTEVKDVPSGGNGICEIAAPSKFTAKDGNYLYFGFENKSGITITVTSKASFKNISSIVYDAVANDNSKPSFTLNIVDDSGNVVKNIYTNAGTKNDFNTGGTNKWGVSNSTISPETTGHIQIILYASSSGKYAAIDNVAVTYSAGPSTDATLKSLIYGGSTPVPGFSPDKLSYDVELPSDYIGTPSVMATANDAAANVSVTQATSVPGTATIVVTAEDGTTKLTYTVNFTRESAFPKVESATWTNISGTATVDNVNMTITGKVTNGSSLTVEPQFNGKNIASWTPTGAQNFSTGAINYTFKNQNDETTTYAVTITEAPAVSSDATLSDLRYDDKTVPGFSPNTYNYTVELPDGTTTAPVLLAFANESHATKEYTQAGSVPGVGKVVVTAEDGITKLTYTVNFTVAVPQTGLSIHVPEVYEEKILAGGYNTPLTVVNGYEYEVYYTERTAEGDYPTFSTTLAGEGKTTGISGSTSKTKNEGRDGDKWFEGTVYSHSECKNASDIDEFDFETKMIREHRLSSSDKYQFHVQGFNQFSLWGMDKKLDPKNGNQVFVVKIDGVEQPTDESLYNTTAYTVRRYDMTSGEHLIEISTTCTGSNVCYMGGFSLRVPQEPRTKWIKGNDSTQTVYARGTIKPVTYFTKYNAKGETKLIWLGNEATGITLATAAQGALGDTLALTGTANCPAGEYHYAVVAYFNGTETSRAEGKFKVINSIQAMTDTVIDAYQNEEMDEIRCKYFVYDEATDLHFNWSTQSGAPGITTAAKNGTFIISGTPTEVGTYYFVLAVTEGDTITGRINVKPLDLGNNPVLYLYKNSLAYEHDGVYQYLKKSGRNLIDRKTKSDLRSADQYSKYKWILISEDVDANNPEVFKIIHGGTNLPVLNMKAFSYAHPIDSLTEEWGGIWGEADNGSISENGKSITVVRDDHPIFKALKKKKGDKIQVLDSIDRRGLMPIRVTKSGSLCLATSLTRDINDYYGDGEEQTFLHEIDGELGGRTAKYICMPIARSSSEYMTDEGKNLLNKVIDYLLSSDKPVEAPELSITRFAVNGITATPNQGNSTFRLEIDTTLYPNLDLTAVVPDIELPSPYLHTEPAVGDTVDLTIAQYIPYEYVVTDYISRRVYEITVRLYKPQGLEEVYTSGEWVNVYDIYGRKIATTNEDIYTMTLPRGIYIVVTESGQTLKITK